MKNPNTLLLLRTNLSRNVMPVCIFIRLHLTAVHFWTKRYCCSAATGGHYEGTLLRPTHSKCRIYLLRRQDSGPPMRNFCCCCCCCCSPVLLVLRFGHTHAHMCLWSLVVEGIPDTYWDTASCAGSDIHPLIAT